MSLSSSKVPAAAVSQVQDGTASTASIASSRHTTSTLSTASSDMAESWRGRRQEPRWATPTNQPSNTNSSGPTETGPTKPARSPQRWPDRSPAPSTTYSARSANWRTQGGSSAGSSVYTRFSNGSERSLSTVATSVSASSNYMAAAEKKKPAPVVIPKAPAVADRAINGKPKRARPPLPPNVKDMSGIPWELDQLPRSSHLRVNGEYPTDMFGSPPVRPRRKQQPKPALDTISERPKASTLSASSLRPVMLPPTAPPHSLSYAASRSHISLNELDQGGNGSEGSSGGKKVQKGQINALAKMLSALKTNRGRD